MFLHVLEEDEARLFADTAWALIHVDDEVDQREESLLAELQIELGVDTTPPELHEPDGLLSRLSQLESPVVRRVMLLELSGVALVDEVVHASERGFLEQIADALGLTEETSKFLDYVADAQSTWRRGRALVIGSEDRTSRG